MTRVSAPRLLTQNEDSLKGKNVRIIVTILESVSSRLEGLLKCDDVKDCWNSLAEASWAAVTNDARLQRPVVFFTSFWVRELRVALTVRAENEEFDAAFGEAG